MALNANDISDEAFLVGIYVKADIAMRYTGRGIPLAFLGKDEDWFPEDDTKFPYVLGATST